VILVISVVLGIIAALAIFSWLRGAQDRADRDVELVGVYVVALDIPKGLPGERAIAEGYIRTDKVNAKFRPANALVQPDAIKGKVALFPLAANVILVDGLFVDPRTEQVTNKERIAPGLVTVTVSIDAVGAVAGLLVPGDRVNILSNREIVLDTVTPDQSKRGFTAGQKVNGRTLLYQNVEILFIGGQAAPQAGETQVVTAPGGGLITFAVPQEAAERIRLAATSDAGLYLHLLPPNNPAIVVPPVGLHNLFGPPCDTIGNDNLAGTADDLPVGCVPLTPYAPATTTTTAGKP